MPRIIATDKQGDDPVLWRWLHNHVAGGGIPWSSTVRTLGLMDGPTILAVVAYDTWFPGGCFMHMAVSHPGAGNREFLRAIFEHPFGRWGLEVVLGLTPRYNERALKLNRKLGFVPFHTVGGAVLQQLRREDCRFIRAAHPSTKDAFP